MTTPVNTDPAGFSTPPVMRHDSTLAVVSLITGILGWSIVPFLGSIVAVITGHLAKKEIRESGGALSGDGMALAGLILGYTAIGIGILVIIALILLITLAATSATAYF
jgi:hypothetical protein